MFGKIKLLAVTALVMLCMACDLDPDKDEIPPGIPTNVRAVLASPISINITWDSVPSAREYDVYVEVGSTPMNKIRTVKGTSHTHTSLQSNTTYNYYVSARNKAGASDLSACDSATTPSR